MGCSEVQNRKEREAARIYKCLSYNEVDSSCLGFFLFHIMLKNPFILIVCVLNASGLLNYFEGITT